MGMKGMLGERN